MEMESEPTEHYERWCWFNSIMRKSCQHGGQLIRWLLAPLVLPTPGAWLVTAMWAFGVVLLAERIFPPAWWCLIGGIVYLALIICIWAFFYTPHPLRQRVVACILVVLAGVAAGKWVQDIIDKVEAKTYIAVEFKSPPLLTAGRRKHIRRDLTAFHDYLTTIGFDIPKKVPFLLGTTTGTVPTFGESQTPGTPYDTFTKISEHAISQEDVIQRAYARFVFHNLLTPYEPMHSFIPYGSALIFLNYYVSSYHRRNLCDKADKWCQALWDIRQRYRQEFTDKVLFYAFQKWQPASTSESNVDAYFMRRLFLGVGVAANNFDQQAAAIRVILKERGLDPEQL